MMLKDKFYEYLAQEDIVPYFQEASEVAQDLADIAEKEIQYLDRDKVEDILLFCYGYRYHSPVNRADDNRRAVDAICKLAIPRKKPYKLDILLDDI